MAVDDTQPRVPRVTINPEEDEQRGAGCGLQAIIGAILIVFSLAIVVLAGTAGWTAGQREASANANATQSADVATQCALFANDVSTGNTVVLNARYQYLATLTPAVQCIGVIPATATALFLTNQPTVTFTPSPTPTITPTSEATAEPQALPTSPGGGYDLAALLEDARNAITLADWETAIETLDVIIALDPTYEAATVRQLMSQALNAYALHLFRNEQRLAEAIVITNRAEEFGPLAEGLNYERYVAQLYLDALRTEGTDYFRAVQAWQAVYSAAPDYLDVAQQLFNAYVDYGNALMFGSPCSAVSQFDAALSIFYDAGVAAQRDNANFACLNPTPAGFTPVPGTELTPTIAPVGQP